MEKHYCTAGVNDHTYVDDNPTSCGDVILNFGLHSRFSFPHVCQHPFPYICLSNDAARALAADLLRAADRAGPKEEAHTPNANPSYSNLTDQASVVFRHMARAGSISAREAMSDHGITSATLARRICDIEAEGFSVKRDRRTHPLTGRRYTRYSLAS